MPMQGVGSPVGLNAYRAYTRVSPAPAVPATSVPGRRGSDTAAVYKPDDRQGIESSALNRASSWPTYAKPSPRPPANRETAVQASENSDPSAAKNGKPGTDYSATPSDDSSDSSSSSREISRESKLSDSEKNRVQELKRIDSEVRTHEAAHIAASGGLAKGGASFSYASGPDGKRYAVGGEVQIDSSAVSGDPQATVLKMQKVRRAAMAPAKPSSQDRAVAAQAARAEIQARMEMSRSSGESTESTDSGAPSDSTRSAQSAQSSEKS